MFAWSVMPLAGWLQDGLEMTQSAPDIQVPGGSSASGRAKDAPLCLTERLTRLRGSEVLSHRLPYQERNSDARDAVRGLRSMFS